MTDHDHDTEGGLPADVLSEAQLLNYRDIAAREFSKDQRAVARTELRETMRASGATDPIQAASDKLAMMGRQVSITVRHRALLYGAALDIRDEGREGREQVATQDRPAPIPEAKSKGRKGKKGGKARHKPARAPTGWVRAIGKDFVALDVEELTDEQVLAMLRAGAGPDGPHIGKEPRSGWCQVGAPLDITFTTIPWVAGEVDTVAIWGLRLDEKKGLPTLRLREEALVTARERTDGSAPPTAEEVSAAYDELAERWYRAATPTTTIAPVTWDPGSGRLLIHTRSKKLCEAMAQTLRASGVTWKGLRLSDAWESLERRDLAATYLRSDKIVGEGRAPLAHEFLLWILARAASGTGVLTVGETRVEFWVDDQVRLVRASGEEKTVATELRKAVTEGGALSAALADGATPTLLRVTLRPQDGAGDFHVTLEDGQARAIGLPALVKPGDSLREALWERLQLLDTVTPLLEALAAAYAAERGGPSWGQRMHALRRAVGLEIAKRWGAVKQADGTVQGFLFAHMLEGEQTTLGQAIEAAQAEATKPSRGRAARDRAAS